MIHHFPLSSKHLGIKRFLFKAISKFISPVNNKYYYSRDYFYERLVSNYNDVDSYLDLKTKVSEADSLHTKHNIFFSKSIKFGSSLSSVKRKLPSPNYQVIGNPGLKCHILFYRIFIGRHKVKLEMHFFQNRLFFFNYNFTSLNEPDKMEILNIMKSKYGVSMTELKEKRTIKDNDGNYIFIDFNINLSINYLCPSDDFFNQANKIFEMRKHRKLTKEIAKYKELYSRL